MAYELITLPDHEEIKPILMELFESESYQFRKYWDSCPAMTTIFLQNTKLKKCLMNTGLDKIFYEQTGEHCLKNSLDQGLGNVWMNKYDENYFQEPHNHISSTGQETHRKCFVYFLDVPENEQLFFFLKDGIITYIREKSGMVVIFDPADYHGVDMNPSNQQRRTISGNIGAILKDGE